MHFNRSIITQKSDCERSFSFPSQTRGPFDCRYHMLAIIKHGDSSISQSAFLKIYCLCQCFRSAFENIRNHPSPVGLNPRHVALQCMTLSFRQQLDNYRQCYKKISSTGAGDENSTLRTLVEDHLVELYKIVSVITEIGYV